MKQKLNKNIAEKATPKAPQLTAAENAATFPLSPLNMWMMVGSVVLIVLGFLLMLGSGTTQEAFNPDIFSTRRIVIGPLISFIGFVAMAFAIIYNNRSKKGDIQATAEDENTAATNA